MEEHSTCDCPNAPDAPSMESEECFEVSASCKNLMNPFPFIYLLGC